MHNQTSLTRLIALALVVVAHSIADQVPAAEFLPLSFTVVDGEIAPRVTEDGSAVLLATNPSREPFIWRRGSGLESLRERLGDGFITLDLSGDGSTIVGGGISARGISPIRISGTWDSVEPLPVPSGYAGIYAQFVSYDGQIVYGLKNNSGQRLLVWNDSNAAPIVHDDFLGLAWDMSSDGQVFVGYADNQPARWSDETGIQPLPVFSLDHEAISELAVSDDGRWTVGTLRPRDTLNRQAVRWDGLSDPEPLAIVNPNWRSGATYISGDGSRIVGVLWPTDNHADSIAALWTEETGMVPLKDLLVSDYGLGEALEGWTLTRVRDISDNGRFLAGFGVNPQGQNEAFLIDLSLNELLTGDYNASGAVEQGDLDLVLLNWGAAVTPAGWTNDLPTGQIDQEELDGVLLNWGNTTAAAGVASAAVPEPSAWLLALICTAGILVLRAQRSPEFFSRL